MTTILFDIGKTNMRVAFASTNTDFEKPLVAPTPANYEDAKKVFINLAQSASMGRPVKQCVGGIPGTLDAERATLAHAPHPIDDWKEKPMASDLKNALGAPVTLTNDAMLVALGEARFGAGKHEAVVGFLTFSTGVGGARITQGEIDRTAYGFEPGKLIVPHLGSQSSIEDYASGSGLLAKYGKQPYDIHDDAVWLEAARAAGYLVHAVTLLWSPSILVLSGPMVLGDPAISIAEIEREARSLLASRENELKLVKAALGGYGGLWGALALSIGHATSDLG